MDVKKTKMVSVRLTENEFKEMENKAKAKGLSQTQLIKKSLFEESNSRQSEISGELLCCICNISAEIERIKINNPEIESDKLEKERCDLWEYVK